MLIAAACGDDDAPAPTPTPATTTTSAPAPTDAPATTGEPGATTDAPAPTNATPEPTPTQPVELEKVTIRGDFFLTVYHAPYFIAADKGWYAEEGLEVEFFEGQGSSSTVQLVAAGEDDFGFAASEAVISAVSQGAPVKMVANIFDDSGLCTMVKADSAITVPKDIEGKVFGAPPFGSSGTLFPAWAAAAGIDLETVEFNTVDFRAVLTGFVEDQFDAVGVIAWGEPITAKNEFGIDTRCMLWKDVGAGTIGHGLIANGDLIANRPDLVEKFVRATLRGFEFLYANPQEGMDIMRSIAPPESTAALPSDETNIPKANVQGENLNIRDGRLGLMDATRFAETIAVLVNFASLENPPAPDDVFTNDFVP